MGPVHHLFLCHSLSASSEMAHRFFVSLGRSEAEPADRLGHVLVQHSLAFREADPEVELRVGVALVCGKPEPFHCCREASRHSPPVVVALAKVKQGFGVALLCSHTEPTNGLDEVFRYSPVPVSEAYSEVVGCSNMPLLGSELIQANCLSRVLWHSLCVVKT